MMAFLKSINFFHVVLSFASIAPWGYFLYALQPGKPSRKQIAVIVGFILGILSTQVILSLYPYLWPDVDFKPTRKNTFLSQTIYIAFIQAGMMEESFKVLFIILASLAIAFDWNTKKWTPNSVVIGGFVALGFSFIENYTYINKNETRVYEMWVGRTLVSSNIHLLINMCFSLFLLKSNDAFRQDKVIVVLYGYLLAVFQHGVVDFFLIPGSKFGSWLSIALFVGIWVWVVQDMRKYVYEAETE